MNQIDENDKVEFIRPDVESAFKDFIEGRITPEKLIAKLKTFDNKLKKLFGRKGNKSIWFRTFKGDTLATSIYNVERYFDLPQSHQNYKHFIECVTLGVNELGMEVYFS